MAGKAPRIRMRRVARRLVLITKGLARNDRALAGALNRSRLTGSKRRVGGSVSSRGRVNVSRKRKPRAPKEGIRANVIPANVARGKVIPVGGALSSAMPSCVDPAAAIPGGRVRVSAIASNAIPRGVLLSDAARASASCCSPSQRSRRCPGRP